MGKAVPYRRSSPNVACADCHTGTYQDQTGKSSCKSCLPGQIVAATSGLHIACTNCENDKRHGHGTVTEASGCKYVGEFKNDNKDGNGTIIRCSGADAGYKYVGQMKNDKIHGQGTYTKADGQGRRTTLQFCTRSELRRRRLDPHFYSVARLSSTAVG